LKKSWLPIKTDCINLDLKSLNNFINISPQLSQTSMIQILNLKKQNLHKTSSLSLQFSQQDFMEDENIKMEKYVIRKFRIYSNQQQLKLFNKCINTSRFFYNKTNEFVIKKLETKKGKVKYFKVSFIKKKENRNSLK